MSDTIQPESLTPIADDSAALTEMQNPIEPPALISSATPSVFDLLDELDALTNVAINSDLHGEIDALTVAITRRDIDLISLVLRFPEFMPNPLSEREKEFIRNFSEFTSNPIVFALKLQSITDLEVGDGNSSTRAGVVAYLLQHREQVAQYLRDAGRAGIHTLQAIETINPFEHLDTDTNMAAIENMSTALLVAEAKAFAEELAMENPVPLSVIQFALQ